ncbi:Putative uncharacterized protein FLJ37770 [Araneus ventricosus]|uniref:Uncharacterized protein n=1 Tax=Araneus ventricosus TaxID=182803 RepID=A0A4Y2D6H1_ARAVE|nr:Putative uncharacterized protein FLJ37770 [Araneus ventricosus]
MEQRVNIKFCFKLGRTATETHEILVKVDAVSKKCVFEWFKRFRDGKEDVKDEPRSGRPPTSTTPDNIEQVRRMLADDRRLYLRMIAEELKINLESVSNIIYEHLQKLKKRSTLFRHYSDPATVLRAIPKEEFADGFQQLYNRCQKCIVTNGDYFEC